MVANHGLKGSGCYRVPALSFVIKWSTLEAKRLGGRLVHLPFEPRGSRLELLDLRS